MDGLDKIIWGFGFSAVGTAFGWILNETSQWLKSSKEENKLLKKVIYNLLETYDIYLRSDLSKDLNLLVKLMYSKFNISDKENLSSNFIKNIFKKLLENDNNSNLKDELNIIQEKYFKSIEELSSIDPISAYHLSGKTKLFENFEKVENSLDSLLVNLNIPNSNDNAKIIIKDLIGTLRPEILDKELTNLEFEIIKLSKRVNYLFYRKIKNTIVKIKKNINEGNEIKMKNYLNKVERLFK